MKRTANAAEKRHMASVASLGCILCELALDLPGSPAQVHHVRVNHGWGRSGHMAVIPLCEPHHTGTGYGVHDMGRDEFKAKYGYSEIELLEVINGKLGMAA